MILAYYQEQLQAALNLIYLYCRTWKLEVNPTKTNVVIFTKRQSKDKLSFTDKGDNIAVVDDYVYILCVTFTHIVSFTKHKGHLLEHDQKAMFSVLRKLRT